MHLNVDVLEDKTTSLNLDLQRNGVLLCTSQGDQHTRRVTHKESSTQGE